MSRFARQTILLHNHPFLLCEAALPDLGRAASLQDLVLTCLADKRQLWPDDTSFWETVLAEGGMMLLAQALDPAPFRGTGSTQGNGTEAPVLESPLAGYFVLRTPGKDAPDNLGRELALSGPELGQVAHLDNVAVHPACRGIGLAGTMARLLVEQARARGKRHLFATVWPDNAASLNMLLSLGMKSLHTRPMYAGWPRTVMYRSLQPQH